MRKVGKPLRPADARPRGPLLVQLVAVDQRLERLLRHVRELEAIRPEELDAVVLVGVVRGADHHADVRPHARREMRDGRRRQRPAQEDPPAHRADPAREGRLEEIAREPRVLPDDDAGRVRSRLLRLVGHGEPDAKRHLRRHRPRVGQPPNPVRPEVLATHRAGCTTESQRARREGGRAAGAVEREGGSASWWRASS